MKLKISIKLQQEKQNFNITLELHSSLSYTLDDAQPTHYPALYIRVCENFSVVDFQHANTAFRAIFNSIDNKSKQQKRELKYATTTTKCTIRCDTQTKFLEQEIVVRQWSI